MSKAIYGQISGSEALLLSEVTRLRRRVRDLEDQVAAYARAFVGRPRWVVERVSFPSV